ncbi:conserved hypothetical protein [Theileria orientalis strain Shintoku]|uniref:Uncharacterized protein n=1 Tax=Theileria orientalis strain Shintoku TaxID=869250 RepID=J4D822_THEOR|nr:conserved hypothetical protein [Theileria orientalis strain Shintoku]BAM40515.1 conserved hypothetical protein [Theileria orientalis strain Shintoku]|eukprot:XP_009690816.1 conserved hypothetical protein [Theileria orientalis strain Shintoku]
MDDVETGYYLELKSTPDMLRKHTNKSSDGLLGESSSGQFVSHNPDSVDPHARSGGEFLGSVNEMYGLDRVKTKLYKEVFKLYTQREDQFDRYGSFETGRVKRKVFLWLMILLLLSNPILGGYNLYHFSNYSSRFSCFTGSELTSMLAHLGSDAVVIPNFRTSGNFSSSDSPNPKYDEDGVGNASGDDVGNTGRNVTGTKAHYTRGDFNGNNVDDTVSDGEDHDPNTDQWQFNPFRWLTRLFNSTDSPSGSGGLGDRFSRDDQELQNRLRQAQEKLKQDLLSVAQFIGKKVSRYCFFEIFGEIIFGLFSLLLLSICRLPCNNSNSVRYMLPTLFMCYMIIYRFLACYVLLTSIKIMFYSLLVYKPRWVFVSSFRKKVLKKSDLNFYSSSETGGFKLFKRCFSRDTFSSSDPHEKYIHSLYNYASDIGTYLKNIEISDYTKGLDDLATKFKNRRPSSSNY